MILLWHAGRLRGPRSSIPLRDVLLAVGYKPAVERGYTFEVNLLGKAATWLLYASLGFTMVTDEGTAVAARPLLDRLRPRASRRSWPTLWKARREVTSVKAVIMAGGEGTRLRPLTSNQPKPMMPIVGKP